MPRRSSTTWTRRRDPAATAPTVTRLLLQAARRAPGWSVLLTLSLVAATVVWLLVPAALAAAVDAAIGRAEPGPALARLGALLVAEVVTELVSGLAAAFYGTATIAWLRHRLLGHVLTLGVPGLRRFAVGDVISRLTGDAPGSGEVLPTVLNAGLTVITSVGAVVALWLIDWRLAGAFLIGLPVMFAIIRVFTVQASDLYMSYRRLEAAIAARLVDALAGMRTIRASGTAHREIDRILTPLPELSATGRALWRAQRQLTWQVGLLQPVLEMLVLAMAGLSLAAGRITPGELLGAAAYARLALGLIDQTDALAGIVWVRAGTSRVAEVLAEPRPPSVAIRPLPDGPGAVVFRAVTVRAGETLLLDRLDLEVPPGLALAIVGRSGAGKTTLASLVGRLTDPDEGEVLLDDVPVTALAPADLRRVVAYAFERPALFGSSVRDAIAYGRPASSASEVEQAAQAAQADGFIRRLPEGYDTALAQVPLSGGEIQRLGLARAIAQGSRVLVLDDATSSLDTVTELQVQATLMGLRADHTCIVVAHRAATAARADLVAWLEGGRIRAVAQHAALWEDPEYRNVFAASLVPVEASTNLGG